MRAMHSWHGWIGSCCYTSYLPCSKHLQWLIQWPCQRHHWTRLLSNHETETDCPSLQRPRQWACYRLQRWLMRVWNRQTCRLRLDTILFVDMFLNWQRPTWTSRNPRLLKDSFCIGWLHWQLHSIDGGYNGAKTMSNKKTYTCHLIIHFLRCIVFWSDSKDGEIKRLLYQILRLRVPLVCIGVVGIQSKLAVWTGRVGWW